MYEQDSYISLFHALSTKDRVRIFDLVLRGREPVVPTLVAEKLGIDAKHTARHLKQMYQAGLLVRVKSGRYTFYSVNEKTLDWIREYFQ